MKDLTDITAPLTKDEVAALTLDQARARMGLIRAAAGRRDWSWSFDEKLWLEQAIPEEKAASDAAWAAHARKAARGRKRLGIK